MNLTTQEKEQSIKDLRDKTIKDTELQAQKQRFALFSQPPPLSIGDDSFDKKKIRNFYKKLQILKSNKAARDENTGKPLIQPRNVQVSATQTGMIKSSFFSQLGFATIGDPYIDPERRRQQDQLQNKAKIKAEVVFKPANGYKTLVNGTYKHETDFQEKKKNFRNADGKVIVSLPNVRTNPMTKVDQKLFKFRPHMQDQYDRLRELSAKERKEHYDKVGEKAPFKSTDHGDKPFIKDRYAYGVDKELPPKKMPKETKLNIKEHEAPFKPSNPPKSGHEGYLNDYPKYIADPIRVVKRIDKKEEIIFKPNHGGNLTRPTVTISCHPANIRRDMQSMGFHKM